MHLDARGRRPAAVWQAGDDDSGACGTGDVEAGAGGGEDGEADSLVNDRGGDGEEGAIFLWFGGGSGRLAISVGGGCLDSLGSLSVGVNAILCRILLACDGL